MKNRKADIRTFVIPMLIAIAVLVIVYIFLFGPGREILARLGVILPDLDANKTGIKDIETIGYNIAQDKPKYYDGIYWVEFPTLLILGDRELESGPTRFYFESYFYRGNRDSALRTISTSNPFIEANILGILGPIPEKEKNGEVSLLYRKKLLLSHLYGKLFVIVRARTFGEDLLYFRYSGDWQWSKNKNDWKNINQEVLEADYFSQNGISSGDQLIPIIKNLVRKDFNSGMIVLLEGDANYDYANPKGNIFTVGLGGAGGRPGSISLYFRYENVWQWSLDKTEWINVPNTYTTSGSYSNINGDIIIKSLEGKDFESGLSRLFVTEPDTNVPEIKEGKFILKIDNSLLFQELENNAYKDPIPITNPTIKNGAIAWRDSVFKHSMPFKYKGNSDLSYVCVKKFIIPDSALLSANLADPVTQNKICPIS